jgi:hypothetical protein
MNYSANKMAAKHCLSAQCIVVDIVPLSRNNICHSSAYNCYLDYEFKRFITYIHRDKLFQVITPEAAHVHLSVWRYCCIIYVNNMNSQRSMSSMSTQKPTTWSQRVSFQIYSSFSNLVASFRWWRCNYLKNIRRLSTFRAKAFRLEFIYTE